MANFPFVCVCIYIYIYTHTHTHTQIHTHVCMPSHFSHVGLFENPWTIGCQAPLSMKFCWQEYWSGLPCPSPEDLLDPGVEPESLMSPPLVALFFTTSATWEAHTHTHTHTHLAHLYPLICCWTLRLLPYPVYLAIVNNVAMTTGVHVSFQISGFLFFLFFFAYIPRSNIVGL